MTRTANLRSPGEHAADAHAALENAGTAFSDDQAATYNASAIVESNLAIAAAIGDLADVIRRGQ